MNEKIEKLISQMTLREKIGQLTQECTSNERMDELCELAKKGEVGSLILANTPFAGNEKQSEIYIDKLNELQRCAVEESRLGIPIINGRDIIHGSKTIFPIPLACAATWDYSLIKDMSEMMCEEAKEDGVHWTFAPMIDMCVEPRWGRIIETPGEDVCLGKMVAKASVKGMKNAGVASCAKHYIGYGAAIGGRDKDATEWNEYTLRNRALPAFKAAVDAGVDTVMSSFNEISGQPMTSSRYHITDILKKELGFEGFVISDYDAIKRLECQGVSDSEEMSAELAINAGVDMDMVDGVYKNNLENLVEVGKVSIETVNEAVRRILRIKFKLGLFENPYINEKNPKLNKEKCLDKSREISLHSMVLLKNNDVLPLKKGTSAVVCGPMAEEKKSLLGSWSAGGIEEYVISLADGIKNVNGEENTVVSNGVDDFMFRYRRTSDTYIVALGETDYVTGENHSVSDIEISQSQINCVKYAKEVGKKVIAVIFAGRPLAITEILPYCDAVLWAWHGGTMCGQAAAEILFGDFNPCGKMPVTIPRATGQIPIYYNHQRNEWGKNNYYGGIDNYVDILGSPLYVFGYGLSYTDFEYNDFEYSFNKKNSVAEIRFKIKNIGEYDGYEIAQCYVNDVVAKMSRPIKELKAFEKVYLKKGEEKEVLFTLTKDDLSYYDNFGEFIFESGDFKIEIGKSCNNIVFESIEKIEFKKG